MKDCNGPQAAAVLLLCNFASAVVSLDSSAFFVPSLVARLLTAAMRSLVCSAAPFTWTLKLQDDLLLAASAAVHPAVESPTANVLPDGGMHVVLVTEQLSDTVGAYETTAPPGPVALTTIGAGQVMAGDSLS